MVLLYGGRYANCPTGCVAPSRSQLWEWDGTNAKHVGKAEVTALVVEG